TISSQSDDGSSPAISLLRSFNYFGHSYSQIYVNHNGDLTFTGPYYSYTPQQFPMYGSTDIIAPFWTDLDNRGNGNIYYVQYTSGSLLQQVTQDINTYFPALNFQANWIFIATWHEVAYYPMTGTVSDLFLTDEAGYDTISSSHHFTIPGSFSSNATGPNSAFSLGSNVNIPGRWAFRVDHGSLLHLIYDFFQVNDNGHLTFNVPWSSYSSQQFPMYGTRDVIAPFWTDLDNRGNGNIYYVQYTSGSLLQRVTQDINTYFPALNFQANWIFIATWHEVAYYPTSGTQTTFQAVLTTNGHYSFVLMNYGSIASTSRSVQVRYSYTKL
uniref:NIDO domain-containing protein n=1 Tax=Poecilia latipinna TaxID=48699 RepID=A0A3B3UBI6_9TELE